jgi:hypothetical protein
MTSFHQKRPRAIIQAENGDVIKASCGSTHAATANR